MLCWIGKKGEKENRKKKRNIQGGEGSCRKLQQVTAGEEKRN